MCSMSSGGLTLRTMMLVAPWRLMSSRASCMLPSPKAISAMTADGADDDAEHREHGPHLVQPQAAHRQHQGAPALVVEQHHPKHDDVGHHEEDRDHVQE